MSKDEIVNQKPNQLLEIVNEIFYFNKEILKKEREFRTKNINPNQMRSRLKISLARLKAGNNSEKFEKKIR